MKPISPIRLSCSPQSQPPEDVSPNARPGERWDDESEIVPRLRRATTLEPEAIESLVALANADSAGSARAEARRLSEAAEGGALSALLDALVSRASEVEQLRRLAGRDELTGLANRRTFNDVMERELARAARSGQPVGLLLLDLDRMKAINDRLGHPAGDRALCEVGRAAELSVRNGDLVARLGGDEFAVVLPDTSLSEALAIGERIREQLTRSTVPGVPLELSFGAAVTSGALEHADDLLREADRALYRDKLARKSFRMHA